MRQPMPGVEVLRRSAQHVLWIVAAAAALVVLRISTEGVVDTAATAALVVALTMGYFVEANALIDSASRNPMPFGLVAGALAGALVAVGVLVVISIVFWLVGADDGVPGGISTWGLVGAVLGGLLGVLRAVNPTTRSSAWRIAERTRPAVFLAPALLFVGATLVVPTVRTVYLGFRGQRGESDLTLENYRDIFGNDAIFNLDGFGEIPGSQLFLFGMLLLAAVVTTVVVRAIVARLRWGLSNPRGLVVLGVATLGLLAVELWLSTLIWDSGTWIVAGTVVPTAVALWVVAGGMTTRREVDLAGPGPVVSLNLVAALVLLAMVGALSGVVWNNLFWVVFVTGLSTIIGLALAVLADRARGESVAKSLIFMPMAISFVGASVIWRFVYAFVPGDDQIGVLNAVWVGGGNEAENWLLMDHWNNLFLLAIMIWIQTGFAMVLLSSAIKGVPTEMLEAARIDGASEAQRFWWVTLPQIRSTLVVVVVTLIITVLKIYDIVKVMTNGEFGTNVIANQMFDEVFRNDAAGRGAALAVLLFVAVGPLMVANVRRLRRGEQA